MFPVQASPGQISALQRVIDKITPKCVEASVRVTPQSSNPRCVGASVRVTPPLVASSKLFAPSCVTVSMSCTSRIVFNGSPPSTHSGVDSSEVAVNADGLPSVFDKSPPKVMLLIYRNRIRRLGSFVNSV